MLAAGQPYSMQAGVDSDRCRILLGYVPQVLALGFGAIANAKNRPRGPTGLGYLTPYMALASSKGPASSTAAPDWVCPYQEMAFVSPYLSAVSIHVQPCLGPWMHAAPVSDVKYHSILRYYLFPFQAHEAFSIRHEICMPVLFSCFPLNVLLLLDPSPYSALSLSPLSIGDSPFAV
jgi:hypothetical protein